MKDESDEFIKLHKDGIKKIVDSRIEQKVDNTEEKEELKEEISRRGFLKKLGVGTAGLGALALSPAAASVKLTKNDILKNGSSILGGGGGSGFEYLGYIDSDTTIDVTTENLPGMVMISSGDRPKFTIDGSSPSDGDLLMILSTAYYEGGYPDQRSKRTYEIDTTTAAPNLLWTDDLSVVSKSRVTITDAAETFLIYDANENGWFVSTENTNY